MALKFHIKRNDHVVVIAGSHKGKEGKSSKSLPPANVPVSKASP